MLHLKIKARKKKILFYDQILFKKSSIWSLHHHIINFPLWEKKCAHLKMLE